MMTKARQNMLGWLYGVLIAAGIAAILYFGLYWWPHYKVSGLRKQVSPLEVFNAEDRTRQTAATIIGGIAVLAGAFLTLRNVRAAERSADIARDNAETARRVAEQNAGTAQRNIKIAEDKQITDRFTAAVNNLSTNGPDKMATRLGGIYALERIARDSPEDHWTVMEVLTAYVRDKRPIINHTEQDVEASDPESPQVIGKLVPTDIQAILTVIGRRDAEQDKGRRLQLNEVDLLEADLRGANLREADLWKANLRRAKLSGADLGEVNLREAFLWGADLSTADMRRADLRKTHIGTANLSQANLGEANLLEAELVGGNLMDANLEKAHLEKANLTRANIENATLKEAILSEAVLVEAELGGANLQEAKLRRAILWGADLKGADLSAAVLWLTNLVGCLHLTQQQLDSARQDGIPASLPDDLHFPAESAPDTPTAPP